MKKIAFDVMGSDNGSAVAIEAAAEFLKDKKDLILVFVGDEKEIKINVDKFKIPESKYEIFATSEVIDMKGSIMDVRRKKDASMVRSLELVKDKKVDAMLTGGSSAAFIAGSHFILGEIEGVTRPGFMPTWPTIKGGTTLFLDAGANLDNSAEDLYGYAKMASIYQESVVGTKKPRIGLLNVGTEDSKGKDFHKEAYVLINDDKKLNFVGNVESRQMMDGDVDIMVTDGYAGNIALKAMEGALKNLNGEIKKSVTRTFGRKLRAAMLRKAFKEVGEKFDYKNYAGAILMGTDGIVFKSHGSSDVKSFKATLRMTLAAVDNDVLTKIKKGMK